MAFKDNFRIEKIYFQRVKDDAQILGSWKNDPRRYSREEIVRVAKDACDSILMLYRLIGECWNDALNQIEKLGAELEALAGKTEAYHDELNEKIDEVNNYLNTQIKNLEIRVENIENSIEDFGGLPSNANAEEGDVLTVGENHVNEWRKGGSTKKYYLGLTYNESTNEYSITDENAHFYVAQTQRVQDPEYGDYDAFQFVHTTKDAYEIYEEYHKGKATIGCFVRPSNTSHVDSMANLIGVQGAGDLTNWAPTKLVFNLVSINHTRTPEITPSYAAALFLTYDMTSFTLSWEPLYNNGYGVVPNSSI